MPGLKFDWKTPDWETDTILYLELCPIGYISIRKLGDQFEINAPWDWDHSYFNSIEECKVQVETTLSHLVSELLKK